MASSSSLSDILAMKTRSQNKCFIEYMDSLLSDLSHAAPHSYEWEYWSHLNNVVADVIRAGCPNLFALLVEKYGYQPIRMPCLSIAVYNGQYEIAKYLLASRKVRSNCEHLVYVVLGVNKRTCSEEQGVELIRLLKEHGAVFTDEFNVLVAGARPPRRIARALMA